MIGMSAIPTAFLVALLMAFVGLASGMVYFRGLRLGVDIFVAGHGWLMPTGLTIARITGLIGILSLATLLGPIALIACFLGFLLARAITLRSLRKDG